MTVATRLPHRLIWILPLAGLLTIIVFVPLPTPTPQDRHISIDATQFQFAPGRVEINYGDHVFLTLTASDVVHGFYLDGYGLQEQITPGISQQIEFIANQTGTFRFRCSVSCGPLHPFMIGELVVGPNSPFWRSGSVLLVSLIGLLVYLWQKKGSSHAPLQEVY